MNRKVVVIGIILVVAIYFLAEYFLFTESLDEQYFQNEVEIVIENKTDNELTFRGVVNPGGSEGCFVDGTCTVLVGDLVIIVNQGRIAEPLVYGTEQYGGVGDYVEVRAKQINEELYTIIGNENYYIKSIAPE